MQIKDIENLAELAKIELNNTEKEALLKDLDRILDYVKQIESVDLPTEMDMSEVIVEYVNKNIWREDESQVRIFSENGIVEQFPDSHDGFVKVKKIM